MKMMTSAAHMSSELPPGFRFHPTDEELIMCYLRNQATSKPCPVSIIAEVDIYKFDPWQLPDKAEFGDKEWYFFSPRDRKYPNGVRPNRATISGYWKATGTDKVIHSGSTHVGVKKALVFYKGRPPKGVKTDWIMHEYRLTGSEPQTKLNRTMRLDDWVLCRIYKKKPMVGHWISPRKVEEQNYANDQTILRTFSESNFLDMDDIGSISQILSDDQFYNPAPETQNSTGYNQQQYRGNEKFQQDEVTYPCIDQGSYQAATQYISKQMLINLNPVYEFQWPAGVLQEKKFDLDIAIDNL